MRLKSYSSLLLLLSLLISPTLSQDDGLRIAGQSRGAHCFQHKPDAERGVTFQELYDFWYLIRDDMDPYMIDQFGCFQVRCITPKAALILCNEYPRPSYVRFDPFRVRLAIEELMDAWWPWWKTLRWVIQEPWGYTGKFSYDGQEVDYWQLLTNGSCNWDDTGEGWQNRKLEEMMHGEVAFEPVKDLAGRDMEGRGWRIRIDLDQPEGAGRVCDEKENFVTGSCRKGDIVGTQGCSWHYKTPLKWR